MSFKIKIGTIEHPAENGRPVEVVEVSTEDKIYRNFLYTHAEPENFQSLTLGYPKVKL